MWATECKRRESKMGSNSEFVEFILGQIENAGEITYRKMFGEYALYANGKIMALVCDDQLYLKPTRAGRAYITNPVEAPPYPGAKPYFLIEDQLEDKDWLSALIRVTVEELPEPKVKSKKKKAKRETK
jgi:TfoX/Sxy family transcriptional regulator of competence genes